MDIEEFRDRAGGPLESFQALAGAVGLCGVLINPLPDRLVTAFNSVALPIIQPAGMRPDRLLARLREILPRPASPAGASIVPLSRERVFSSISRLHGRLMRPAPMAR
jgi:hypothetical protein